MSRFELPISELPSSCFANEQARRIAGRVSVAPQLRDRLSNLRIFFHGSADPESLEDVEISLDSVPNVYVAISGANQKIRFSEGCSGSWVFHFFGPGTQIEIGAGTTSNGVEVLCNAGGHLTVGKDGMFAGGITIHVGDNHAIFDVDSLRVLNHRPRPYVRIEDHVWVGQRASIIGDCVVGRGSVIAGYSVLPGQDIPPLCLAAGVPAAIRKEGISWTRSYQGEGREIVLEKFLQQTSSSNPIKQAATPQLTPEVCATAYQLILGRPPENEQVIADHMRLESIEALRKVMMQSPEFLAIARRLIK